MKKTILLAFVALMISATAFGQRDETLFNKLKFTGAWGGNAFNFAQIGENYTTLTGGYGGLEFGKDVFIGYGRLTSVGDFFLDNTSSDRYSMSYSGLLLGYAPNAHKSLHLQTNLMVGGGSLRNLELNASDDFIVVQPYVGVEVNVVRWMRIGIGGGYRAVFDNSLPNINTANLSNAFGEVRFKFGWSWGK
jgi:hypothetical protein